MADGRVPLRYREAPAELNSSSPRSWRSACTAKRTDAATHWVVRNRRIPIADNAIEPASATQAGRGRIEKGPLASGP